MYKKLVKALMILLVLPFFAIAQGPTITPLPGGFVNLINNLKHTVLTILWMFAVTFTIIMFVWAGFQYLTAKGDPSKISEAHRSIIWGTVGAVVIVLAWSIIAILRLQFGI